MDFDSTSTPLFSCGLDLAGLAISSDLLHYSWDVITELRTNPSRHVGSSSVSVEYRESQVRNYRIIAFIVSPVTEKYLQEGSDLVKEGAKSTSYIITGHSLGGSIASLFMLWLLNELEPTTTRRPLCITFGAPLLGDSRFQQAIYHYSTWNSCFLHTVHRDDPFPSIFAAMDYRPFGTFLFLSGSGKACFEAPDSILELLMRMKPERGGNQDLQDIGYGPTIQSLRSNFVCKDVTELSRREIESYKAGIIAQLTSIGLLQNELEWYKKMNENEGYAYYDSYKIKRHIRDHRVVEFKRILTDYWEKLVEEEAMIACEDCNNGEEGSFERLVEFETYVFGLIERYSVSPEIFLPKSTYMKWWKKYEGILMRRSARQPGLHNSKLVPFMKNGRYHEYKEGKYDPSKDDE
ncbi:hypothetical protein CRG98_045818 [Punica granatum]|uniref:Senescence-associated carboxylesterase 101-like n=1 Tax=Punica granatum TaxID=22663 RepID=A0A2I0HPZ1_PUNGR|nr:hypothetical protein CRG98_045818 [Punica granatum]